MFGPGYEDVLAEMLLQGSNYAHVQERRLVWLRAIQPLLQVCYAVSLACKPL